eukprot:scaffold3271_cov82-Skeletonema_dohrnii-CCMP3373.AAC.5
MEGKISEHGRWYITSILSIVSAHQTKKRVTQARVCPPHFFAWGTNWPDALKSLYDWHHGLTIEQQKREKHRWSNLPPRQKKSYNKNIKTLEENVRLLSLPNLPNRNLLKQDTPPPQQVTTPSRSSSRVVEQRATNLSIQGAQQKNGPSETACAAAGYIPPSDAAASAETNNTASSLSSGRRGRQRTTTATTVTWGECTSRRAQADSQAAKAVKKAPIAGAVSMDTCHFPGLSEDQDNDLPRQLTVVCTLNMFSAYNSGGGRQRTVRAPRPTLTITAVNRTDVALVNQRVEHYVNAVENICQSADCATSYSGAG